MELPGCSKMKSTSRVRPTMMSMQALETIVLASAPCENHTISNQTYSCKGDSCGCGRAASARGRGVRGPVCERARLCTKSQRNCKQQSKTHEHHTLKGLLHVVCVGVPQRVLLGPSGGGHVYAHPGRADWCPMMQGSRLAAVHEVESVYEAFRTEEIT
eukprot:15463380-Alexandrium_andersonii.AAC.1